MDALGRFDFEGYQADEDSIKSDYAKYTDAQGNSIVDSVFAGLRDEEHPIQTRWREAKDIIEPWFNVPDDMADAVTQLPGLSNDDKRLLSMYLEPGAEKKTRDLVALASKRKSGLDIVGIYNKAVDAMRAALRNETATPGAVALNRELVAWDLASLSLSTMRLGNIEGFIQNLDQEALQELITSVTP